MRTKQIILGFITLAVCALSYLMGLRQGELQTQRRIAKRALSEAMALYDGAESGSLQTLRSGLGMLLLDKTRSYESVFGDAPTPDGYRRLLEAQLRARQIETNLVLIVPE